MLPASWDGSQLTVVQSGVHRVKDDNERQFLAEQIIGSMTDWKIGPLTSTGVEALVDITFSSSATNGPSDQVSKPVFEWIDTTWAEVTLPSNWENGEWHRHPKANTQLTPFRLVTGNLSTCFSVF